MAVDMFLKIDGVEGESQSSKHKGEIDVLSYSWGMTQAGNPRGGGGGAGKITPQDFSIVKQLDTASPQLMEMACRGEHAGSALLTLSKAGGEGGQDYMKIKLTDVIISNYSTGGSTTGLPAEQITFMFSQVEISAAEVRPDGSIGGWKNSTSCVFSGRG